MTHLEESDGAETNEGWLGRLLRAALLALVVGLVAISVARVTRAWPRDSHLGYAEGIWLGLASDAAQGVWYRPLDGPLGYGGTRYFPLFFTAHAGLIRAGLSPIAAGYSLAGVSIALLAAGIVLFLRRLGAGWLLATASAAVALSCQPGRMALLAFRGDALAAALVMFGLAACAPGGRLRAAPWWFALAFATKATSLYGPVAALVALASNGRGAEARRLAWQTGVAFAAVLALMVLGSSGRVVAVFAASVPGGTGISSLLAAPLSFVRILRRVPESAFFIQVAAAAMLGGFRWRMPIERIALITCAASTIAIYASPATIENHLIDLTVLAVIVLAGWAVRDRRLWLPVMALLIVGGLGAGATDVWRARSDDAVDLRAGRRAVVAALADTRGPILFEQPLLDAERGESPYILDLYIFSVRVARDPAVANRLLADLDQRRFGAVVLEAATLDLAFGDTLTGESADRFREALTRNYRLDAVVGGRPIYRPR